MNRSFKYLSLSIMALSLCINTDCMFLIKLAKTSTKLSLITRTLRIGKMSSQMLYLQAALEMDPIITQENVRRQHEELRFFKILSQESQNSTVKTDANYILGILSNKEQTYEKTIEIATTENGTVVDLEDNFYNTFIKTSDEMKN